MWSMSTRKISFFERTDTCMSHVHDKLVCHEADTLTVPLPGKRPTSICWQEASIEITCAFRLASLRGTVTIEVVVHSRSSPRPCCFAVEDSVFSKTACLLSWHNEMLPSTLSKSVMGRHCLCCAVPVKRQSKSCNSISR